jgi:hypothetical protein
MEEAVKRGAALLDRSEPGWSGKIDLETLDLKSHTSCVLGQLHGEYSIGLSSLMISRHGGYFGFYVSEDNEYPVLTDLWRQEITFRRN